MDMLFIYIYNWKKIQKCKLISHHSLLFYKSLPLAATPLYDYFVSSKRYTLLLSKRILNVYDM
jgi:hypothetical protein